jgi:hypothetical protein
MNKHDSHYSSHRCGANQEYISVLQLLCRAQLKDEAIIYPGFPPHENVATIQKEVQEHQGEHAANNKLSPFFL